MAERRRLRHDAAAVGHWLPERVRDAVAEPRARFRAALHAFPAGDAKALGAEGDALGRMDVGLRGPRARAFLAELRDAEIVGEAEVRRLSDVIARAPVTTSASPVL